MSTEQQLIAKLLQIKMRPIEMLQMGHFMIHPKDALDEINKLLEIHERDK